jgi:hypothetical protein
MRGNKFSARAMAIAAAGASFAVLLTLPACKVNVEKERNGEDKQVDIKTFAGGLHVSNDADAADTGLTIYPGARLKPKDSGGDSKSANVNLSGFGYSLKVVALEYESDAAPAQVISFYKDQLKKYGSVLECHTSGLNLNMNPGAHGSKGESNELSCEGDSGGNIELKVGKKDDQHIVAVEPAGKGSSFSLVYIRTHGKDAEI